MKIPIYIFYFLLVTTSFKVAAQGTWTKKADFGGNSRTQAVGFSIGNKGYIGLGSDEFAFVDFWQYDPATDSWSQKADFPGKERYVPVGFSIGNKGYVGLGANGVNFLTDFWEYNPLKNVWKRKADFAGAGRGDAVGFSIGYNGYVGTGETVNGYAKDFWEYNPALNKWKRRADFGGEARGFAVGFSVGWKGYIGTGISNAGYKKDFWEYNPVTNKWTQRADIGGEARAFAVGFKISNKGYIGIGWDNSFSDFFNDFWQYDPATNKWVQKADILHWEGAVGFSIGQKGFIGTGDFEGDGSTTDFFEFDPLGTSTSSGIVLSATPEMPSVITGPSTVAAHQTGIVFSVDNAPVNFNWSIIPLDAVITSGWGTNKITVNWGSTGGYVGVSASNAYGISDTRGKAVSLNGASAAVKLPSTINANFDIYPNPAKNNCTVVFNETKQVHYSLFVTNTNGKTIFIKQGISFEGINMITVDMSSFPAGIYLVNLFDVENGTRNERLTKE